MKYILALALCAFTLVGCQTSNLETGGAYAPGTNGVATVEPDMPFFVIDSAFDLAYSSIDAAFKFEKDNRAYLWKLNPKIKHTFDSIRPQAQSVVSQYTTARKVYIKNPVPAQLNILNSILAHAQQLADTAASVLPKP